MLDKSILEVLSYSYLFEQNLHLTFILLYILC